MTETTDIRRTKIVCTIGPATRTVERMSELIEAGADVFRLNFSHGTAADHAENVAMTREAGQRCTKEIGILGDLPGPKLRLGDVKDGLIELPADGEVELTTDDIVGDPARLPVSWEGLPGAVREGGEVYLADGRIRLRVESKDETSASCRVEVGGPVASRCPRPAATTWPGSTSRSSTASTCSPSRSCAAPRTWNRSTGASAPAAPTSR